MEVVRSGTLTLNSPIITGLKRTDDLNPGIYVYGNGIPVGSYILSKNINGTDITISFNATVSGSNSLEFTTARVGTYLERRDAQLDAKNIIDERGDYLEIFLRGEGQVTRDSYGSIKKRIPEDPSLRLQTFPVEFNPSEKQLEKAGIREKAEVICYTAMLDWINAGYSFKDIDLNTRMTVNLQNQEWELKNKGLSGQMNDSYLYITLGLFKK